MKSLHLRIHVDLQGQVTFKIPDEFVDQDIDLLVIFESLSSTNMEKLQPNSLQWPVDFFEKIAGSLPDFPAVESEGLFEMRESLKANRPCLVPFERT